MAQSTCDENDFGSCNNPSRLEDHFLYFSHLNEDDDDDYDAQMPCKRAKRELKEISKLPPPLWLRLTITPQVIEEKLNGADDEAARTSPLQANKVEKLKAVHLPICSLKIGCYLIEAQYPAHLVAKFYFAKRKFVWEILNKGLKHKIEIQWHHISAIRACIEENKPGILEIELDRVPSFYRETKPQPRKHTVWTSSPDFTENYCASQYRRHFLRFPPGVLNQHYYKLLQLDNRLLELSWAPFPSFESSYFDSYQDEDGTTTHIHFGHHDLQSIRSRTTPSSEQPVIILDPPPISTQTAKLNVNTMPFTFGATNNLISLSSAFEQQQQHAFDLSVFLTQQVQPYGIAIKDPTSLSSFDLPVISTQQVRLYKDMMMPLSASDINDSTSLSSGICSPTNETINNQLLQDRRPATCNPELYCETTISSSTLCLLPTTHYLSSQQ